MNYKFRKKGRLPGFKIFRFSAKHLLTILLRPWVKKPRSSQSMNKNIKLTFLNRINVVWFLAFAVFTLHVFLAIQTSSMGIKIALYEEEIKKLEKENSELSMKLINTTSLTKLNHISEEIGFKKIDNTLYLNLGDSFAKAN